MLPEVSKQNTTSLGRPSDFNMLCEDISRNVPSLAPGCLWVSNVIASWQLTVLSDNDADGIPNSYENGLAFLNPLDPDDAIADEDEDGVSNVDEYVADTNPDNSNSFLRVTGIGVSGSTIDVSWTGGSSVWQYLEYTGDLTASPTNWHPLTTNSPPTPISTNYFFTDTTNRMLFYRIRVSRQ